MLRSNLLSTFSEYKASWAMVVLRWMWMRALACRSVHVECKFFAVDAFEFIIILYRIYFALEYRANGRSSGLDDERQYSSTQFKWMNRKNINEKKKWSSFASVRARIVVHSTRVWVSAWMKDGSEWKWATTESNNNKKQACQNQVVVADPTDKV